MIKKILLYFGIFSLIFCYSFFLGVNISDEIWNYGFGYNISKGLVIYRDFNVLQTPLIFFLGSVFVKIFGHHLWSIHILNSIILFITFIVLYKDIGTKSFIIIPFIILHCLYSYSILCVLFLVLILYINNHDYKNKYLYISFIVGLMFITKQHIGICLFVPMIIYSNNKFKSLILFLIPFILLSVYLIYYDAFYNFIDCCFLGMFDFGTKNSHYGFLTYIWLLQVIYLLYRLIITKFDDSNAFYILCFHVISIPIIDLFHYTLCFVFILYYFISIHTIKKYRIKYFIIMSVFYFIISLIRDETILNFNIYRDKNSFMYGRNISYEYFYRTGDIYDYINKNKIEYKDNIYIVSNNAYLIKLEMGIPINNYDLLLDGNMGYNGDIKRINQLNNICSYSKCLFIIDKDIAGIQLNKKIRNYVIDNYEIKDEIEYYLVYSN